MFFFYLSQAVVWYIVLVIRTKDTLNPFAISFLSWMGGAAISQLKLSELVGKWCLEMHILVLLCGYVIVVVGLVFSRKEKEFYYIQTECIVNWKFKIAARLFFVCAFACAFIEWYASGYYIPLFHRADGGDLKAGIVAISGVHYGTVCFPYCALLSMFELLYDKKSSKLYHIAVISLTVLYVLGVQMSRGDLLIIILGGLYIFHTKKNLRISQVITIGGGIVAVLIGIMLVRVQNMESLVYSATNNPYISPIYMYIATCYDNLNSLVKHGSEYTILYTSLIKPICEVINLEMPIHILDYNVVFFNAKTFLYYFYYDLGSLGGIVFPLAIYGAIGLTYKKVRGDGRFIPFLAALQKALLMVFFGNYFTGTVVTTFPLVLIFILCCLMPKTQGYILNKSKTKLKTEELCNG